MSTSSPGMPGQRDVFTATPRNVLVSDRAVVMTRGVVSATYAYDGKNTKPDELRPGCLMAYVYGLGMWMPMKRTRVESGTSGSGSGRTDVNLKVEESRFFKIGDTISVAVAAGTVNRTISDIDYDIDMLTLDTAVDNPVIGGAVIARGTLDGAQTCRGILDTFLKLMDEDGEWRDKPVSNIVISGYVDVDAILGDLTAARADTSARLEQIMWSDRHGEDA